jgi:hypothetical protein
MLSAFRDPFEEYTNLENTEKYPWVLPTATMSELESKDFIFEITFALSDVIPPIS